MPDSEIVSATQRLLGAIATGDYETYAMYSDPSLTAIEPETSGNIIQGLGFHKYVHLFDASDEDRVCFAA